MHRPRFAASLLRAARGQRREPARDPRLGRLEPERSPDGRAVYARSRPEGALPQRRREGGGMTAASFCDLNAFRPSMTGDGFTDAQRCRRPTARYGSGGWSMRSGASLASDGDNDLHGEHDFGGLMAAGLT